MYLDEQGKCLRQLLNREAANVFTRVFHKRHFEEEKKSQPSTQLGGTQEEYILKERMI